MYIILAIILLGLMLVVVFILGGIFTRHVIMDALEEARHQRMAEDSYRLAGVRAATDPKPYIPPTVRPRTPRARPRVLPHMNTLDRLLHEGKRGTVLVRAGDHRK